MTTCLIWLTRACLALAATPAMAQQAAPPPVPVCHDTPAYFVITREHSEGVGSAILVRKKPTPATRFACSFTRMPGDYLNDDTGGAAYFMKMQGPYLLLDNGTGTERDLTIFDVTTGQRVLDHTGYYQSRLFRADGQGVTFWQVGAEATPGNCPRLAARLSRQNGAIITLVTFDFATRQIRKTQQTACIDRP